jgi:uncharacterized protein YlxW (UPF0749 family)
VSPYRTPGEPTRDASNLPEKKPLEPRHYWYSAAVLLAFTVDYLVWACGAGLVWMPIAPLTVLCMAVVSAAVTAGDKYFSVRRDEWNEMVSANNTLRKQLLDLQAKLDRSRSR